MVRTYSSSSAHSTNILTRHLSTRTKVNTFLSEDLKITKELMCTIATAGQLGTCPGDSGGPLVIHDQETDANIQIGAVFGSLVECDDQKYPSLYARIEDYEILKFIRETAFGQVVERPDGLDGTFLKSYQIRS